VRLLSRLIVRSLVSLLFVILLSARGGIENFALFWLMRSSAAADDKTLLPAIGKHLIAELNHE